MEDETTIDWEQIHRRLKAVETAIGREFIPTEQNKKEILRTRAEQLAREDGREPTAEETLEVIEFCLATETYALEMAYVQEVYSLKEITPLPCVPSFVKGIVNVRGQIFSVIDLKEFFALPTEELAALNKVIIMHTDDMEFGILVDNIIGGRSVPRKAIQPAPSTLTGVQGKYAKGVTSERLIILDAAKILTDRRMIVNENVGG